MAFTTYVPIVVMFLVLYLLYRRQKAVIARKMVRKRRMEGHTAMVELARRFIGKECLIYAFDGNHQFQGTIREVTDNGVLVENGGSIEAINLDFVSRIREYPRNKKGKKKSVILD